MTGTLPPIIAATNFNLSTTGSSNASTNIANAKLFYTGTSATFTTTTQFGSTISNPSGAFSISGSQNMVSGINHFWLTYDINAGATWEDSVKGQCLNITGSGSMGIVVPTTTAPIGSSIIDPYCLGTVTYSGQGYNIFISNVNVPGEWGVTLNNTTGCTGIFPFMWTTYLNQKAYLRQGNSYPFTVAIPSYTNPTAFGVWVDWNSNYIFTDAGEFFPTSVISSAGTIPATGTIIVPATATIGNHRMRIRANLSSAPTQGQVCSNLTYGEQEDYTIQVLVDTNMKYISSTTTRTDTSGIYRPYNDAKIISVQVVTAGGISPLPATNFTFNTSGSSNPGSDITNAHLYYTGTSNVFSTTTQFGIQNLPSGAFNITGTQSLSAGTNYFWLTYDVGASATIGDTVNCRCNLLTIGGSSYTPTVQLPAGLRKIVGASLCGTYTIPTDYASISAAITAINTAGVVGCPVTIQVPAGWRERAGNLTLNVTGSPSAPIKFVKINSGANPLITATAGTGIYDGIIKLNGVSYITFDGIDLTDTASNTTTTTMMEWGYALLRPDATHGCQYDTIRNCTITLNKTNTSNSWSYGIFSNNITLTGTSVTPTSTSGTNSYNSFINVNLTKCFGGFYIQGYNDPNSPYNLYDHYNIITSNGLMRSSVTDFGYNVSATYNMYGVYATYQDGFTVSNTYFNNNTASAYNPFNGDGIYIVSGTNSNATVIGDTITIVSNGASYTVYGIYNTSGANGTSNTINISNNVITGCTDANATTQNFYGIYQNSSAYNVNVNNNQIVGNSLGGTSSSTGTFYGVYANGGNTAIEKFSTARAVGGASGASILLLLSMSMRPRIGIVHEFDKPGMRNASFISATSCS